jgi:hypothetical protein
MTLAGNGTCGWVDGIGKASFVCLTSIARDPATGLLFAADGAAIRVISPHDGCLPFVQIREMLGLD